MADGLNFLMLICAVLGATAFGILTAYALLRMVFALMRRPQMGVAPVKVSLEAARIL